MGGLYISPSSSEISWKRRGIRVSSEALLCLGVSTTVASFVVDIAPEMSKPNVWILTGGLIMIVASIIGWSLTFCLMFDPEQQAREDNNFTGIVISQDKQLKLPMAPALEKSISTQKSLNQETDLNNLGFGFGNHKYQNQQKKKLKKQQTKIKINKKAMKAVDKNAPIHSVEVVVPPAFLQNGDIDLKKLAELPDNLTPNIFDQFFSGKNLLTEDKLKKIGGSKKIKQKFNQYGSQIGPNTAVNGRSGSMNSTGSSRISAVTSETQLQGYDKLPKVDPKVAAKLGKIPPIPTTKRNHNKKRQESVAKNTLDRMALERERARSKKNNLNKKSQQQLQHQHKNSKKKQRRAETPTSYTPTETQTRTEYRTEYQTQTYVSRTYSDSYSETTRREKSKRRVSRSISRTYSDSYSDDYSDTYEEVKYDQKGKRVKSTKNNNNQNRQNYKKQRV